MLTYTEFTTIKTKYPQIAYLSDEDLLSNGMLTAADTTAFEIATQELFRNNTPIPADLLGNIKTDVPNARIEALFAHNAVVGLHASPTATAPMRKHYEIVLTQTDVTYVALVPEVYFLVPAAIDEFNAGINILKNFSYLKNFTLAKIKSYMQANGFELPATYEQKMQAFIQQRSAGFQDALAAKFPGLDRNLIFKHIVEALPLADQARLAAVCQSEQTVKNNRNKSSEARLHFDKKYGLTLR